MFFLKDLAAGFVYLSSKVAQEQASLVSRSTLTIEKWKAEQQLVHANEQFLSISSPFTCTVREEQNLRNSQVLNTTELGLDRSTDM
jgi:hypothetical protein